MELSSSPAVTHFPPCAHSSEATVLGVASLAPLHPYLGLPLDGNSQNLVSSQPCQLPPTACDLFSFHQITLSASSEPDYIYDLAPGP